MLPSIGPFANMQKAADNVDEGQLVRVEAIINSMTQHERLHHEVINGSRRKRIARGSGTSVQLKQWRQDLNAEELALERCLYLLNPLD